MAQESSRWFGPGQQLSEIVVDARHPEVGLALEGPAQVQSAMLPVVQELHEGEDEVFGLVETGEDFVLGHRDRVRSGDASLDLDET